MKENFESPLSRPTSCVSKQINKNWQWHGAALTESTWRSNDLILDTKIKLSMMQTFVQSVAQRSNYNVHLLIFLITAFSLTVQYTANSNLTHRLQSDFFFFFDKLWIDIPSDNKMNLCIHKDGSRHFWILQFMLSNKKDLSIHAGKAFVIMLVGDHLLPFVTDWLAFRHRKSWWIGTGKAF